jgi:hypothetical protein
VCLVIAYRDKKVVGVCAFSCAASSRIVSFVARDESRLLLVGHGDELVLLHTDRSSVLGYPGAGIC